MKRFGKKFRVLLKKLKVEVELLKSYVDDVTNAAKSLDKGVRFDENKMKMVRIEELVEGDKNVPDDERTMEEVKKIANTIFKCIQFTTDCPSNNQSGKVPVLDLQLYVGRMDWLNMNFMKSHVQTSLLSQHSQHIVKR